MVDSVTTQQHSAWYRMPWPALATLAGSGGIMTGIGPVLVMGTSFTSCTGCPGCPQPCYWGDSLGAFCVRRIAE